MLTNEHIISVSQRILFCNPDERPVSAPLILKNGDVVVAKSPTNPKQTVCKRIGGVEGEIVTVPPQHALGHERHHVVPTGHVWLQGDNQTNSTDSRAYGAVPVALIRGRVFYKIWPLSEARRI